MDEQREALIHRLQQQPSWDLIVVGAGILGAGIYAYAQQLGLKVLLIDQQDFAWGSSSRSSKMVHGGLRYVAQGQLGLTKESVVERQTLLEAAPGLVESASYVMSHRRGQFPSKGLFGLLMHIYGFFAGSRQHQSLSAVDYQLLSPGTAQDRLTGGTQYLDALTDDARLVYRLIQQTNTADAMSINYCQATGLLKEHNALGESQVVGVRVQLAPDQSEWDLPAKLVVNATGAWSDQLDPQVILRPLRGSHIIVPSWRLPVANVVTLLHPQDQRPMMIYPWQNTTLIGTTDIDHESSMTGDIQGRSEPKITQQELDYIFELVDAEFPAAQLTAQDVISTYAGVRPIVLDKPIDHSVSASDEKRTHSLFEQPGMITVCGGKLTTFRLIAEQVLTKAASVFQWQLPLPSFALFDSANPDLAQQFPYLAGRYGAALEAYHVEFPPAQYQQLWQTIRYTPTYWLELLIAVKNEQVYHLDDLLLRRTRLGNILPDGGADLLDEIQTLCSPYLSWDLSEWQQERRRYLQIWQTYYSLPNS